MGSDISAQPTSGDRPPAPTKAQIEAAVTFRIAEYNVVEARLQFLREDLVRTETIAPLAVAALYSWAFSRDDLTAVGGDILFLIPCIISLVAFLRHQARYNAVYRIEGRMSEIEHSFLDPVGGTGYESWLITEKPKRKWYHPPLLVSRLVLWSFMLAGTVSIAAIMLFNDAEPPRATTRIVVERVNP